MRDYDAVHQAVSKLSDYEKDALLSDIIVEFEWCEQTGDKYTPKMFFDKSVAKALENSKATHVG